jgi:hypothetical protein
MPIETWLTFLLGFMILGSIVALEIRDILSSIVAIGVVGLGVMGQSLALNLASRGYSVAGFDLETKQAEVFAAKTSSTAPAGGTAARITGGGTTTRSRPTRS